jgi:cyclophilin family peptidyl-prolyl cis-trans isomerase
LAKTKGCGGERRQRGRDHPQMIATGRFADHLGFPPMEESSDRRLLILAAFAVIAIGVVAAILIGRSGGSDDSTATTASAEGCKQVQAPKPKTVSYKAPKQTVKTGEKLTAVVATSCGTFEIALDTARAPKTANSFAFLAEKGFYDDLTFHRIAPGFVIQGGDPLGTGTGGPGYKVVEKPPANLAYTKGIVAMAKSPAEPPGTSGSQFFVVLGADAGLPPEYALVGKVSKGFDVVARIGKLGTPAEKPTQTILTEKITVEKG